MTDPLTQQSNDLARSLALGDLLSLGAQLRSDITPTGLVREVIETIQRVVHCPHIYVRLREGDSDHLNAVAFAGITEATQQGLSALPVAPLFFQALLTPDHRVSESYRIPVGVSPEPQPGAALSADQLVRHTTLLVPLRGRGERLMGMIYASEPEEPHTLTLTDVHIIEAIARQAALALENVRLADRSARLLAKEQLLAELGRDVSATLDLDMILARAIARLDAAFHTGTIALIQPVDQIVVVAAAGRRVARTSSVQLGVGIIGWVAQQGSSFFSNNVLGHEDLWARHPAADEVAAFFGAAQPLAACIAVPLWSGGQVIGTLSVGNAQLDAFSYDDVDLLEAIAAQIGGPITSARLYEESQRLAAQVQRRADQLTALNTLARIATATLDLDQTLIQVTQQIQRGFGYRHVELYVLEDEATELVLAAQAGLHPPVQLGYRQHVGLGLLGRAVRTGQTQQVDDVQFDREYLQGENRSDTRAELVVPIVASGRVLGLLNLESQAVGTFTGEDVAVLETAADMLAGVIENARLNRRAQAAAVLEERNRLARELHDSVTQQLFSMTLSAQAARTHLEKNPQRVAVLLERLQETATAALAEMRALIFQLRPPALSEQGLLDALQQHAAAISRREGLRVELSVTGDERLARGIEQPLYRIVQEAINNVVKHANATLVRVQLELTSERVRVRVADDGQGFDTTVPPDRSGRHLGLIGMRERAAEIGGTMDLRSSVGGGTEVVVTVLRMREDVWNVSA